MTIKLTLVVGLLMAASAGFGGFIVYQRTDTHIAVLRTTPSGQRDYIHGLDQSLAAECANLKRLTGHEPADCHPVADRPGSTTPAAASQRGD